MITKDMIIIILCIYFTYLALFKERQSLGCKGDSLLNFLSSDPPCDNADNQYSRIIREEKPQNPFDVFNRMVIWRRSFLLSVIIILIYHLLLEAEFDGVKFMSGVIIGTFFIYFSFNFYKYHLDYYIYNEIMKNYNITPKV
jgi:hypothetical protein